MAFSTGPNGREEELIDLFVATFTASEGGFQVTTCKWLF
jgi:hypothetical protein